MKFEDGFFDKMKFNVYGLPEGKDVLEAFPSLQSYPVFQVSWLTYDSTQMDFDRNKVLRYIFFCYDENLKWDVIDFETQKIESVKLAGIKDKSFANLLINNYLPEVNEMIIEFFKIQNNRKYRWKIQAMELLYQYDRIIMEPINDSLDDDKRLKAAMLKTKLLADCKKMGDDIDSMEKQYFGSKEEAEQIIEIVPISPQNMGNVS